MWMEEGVPTTPQVDSEPRDAFRRLADLAAELSAAVDIADVAEQCSSAVIDALGADGIVLCMTEGDGDEHLVIHPECTIEDSTIERWTQAPGDEPLPARDALRSQRPVVIRSREDRDRRYPELRQVPMDREGWVLAPMRSHEGRPVGVLMVAFAHGLDPADVDTAFVQAVADLFAAALHRARLYERQGAALQREQFLAEAGALLARSLDTDTTMQRIARLAVPQVADICVVYRATGDGLSAVAAAHCDPDGQQVLDELIARGEHQSRVELRKVLETGEPLAVPTIDEDWLARHAEDERSLELLRSIGSSSVLGLCLTARERAVGVLALAGVGGRNVADERTTAVAQALADRAATAIDNADLFAEREALAEQLQEALDTRLVIEQAKGAIGATRGMDPERAFETLRDQARSEGRRVHDVARELLATLTG